MSTGAVLGCRNPRQATGTFTIAVIVVWTSLFPPPRVSAKEMEAPQASHHRKDTIVSSHWLRTGARAQQRLPFAKSWGNHKKNASQLPNHIRQKNKEGECIHRPHTRWTIQGIQTGATPLSSGLGKGHGVSVSLWHYRSRLHLQLKTVPRQTIKIST